MADYTVTAANVIASATASKKIATAGESVTAGQSAFVDATKTLYKADANVEAKSKANAYTLNAASTGQPVVYITEDAELTPGFTIAAGEVVMVSITAGGFAPVADATTGDYVTIAMVGIGGNKARLSFFGAGAPKP